MNVCTYVNGSMRQYAIVLQPYFPPSFSQQIQQYVSTYMYVSTYVVAIKLTNPNIEYRRESKLQLSSPISSKTRKDQIWSRSGMQYLCVESLSSAVNIVVIVLVFLINYRQGFHLQQFFFQSSIPTFINVTFRWRSPNCGKIFWWPTNKETQWR